MRDWLDEQIAAVEHRHGRRDPGWLRHDETLWLRISRWWAWYAGPTLLGLGIVIVMVLTWFWLVIE